MKKINKYVYLHLLLFFFSLNPIDAAVWLEEGCITAPKKSYEMQSKLSFSIHIQSIVYIIGYVLPLSSSIICIWHLYKPGVILVDIIYH